MAFVYIAGYITRNDNQPSECETYYYEKYGKYTNLTDRGKLWVPFDQTCQWLFFCFILFYTIKEKVCYKSLNNIFMLSFLWVSFFQHGEKVCFYFCKYSLEKFLQTWHTQIRKRTSCKSFETFLEWFCFICLLFWNDWLLYTYFSWCLPAFSGSVCQTQ